MLFSDASELGKIQSMKSLQGARPEQGRKLTKALNMSFPKYKQGTTMLVDCDVCGKRKTDKFRVDPEGEPVGHVCDACWKGRQGKTIPDRDIWDYCFECGRPLTVGMKEGKDWFDIRNAGEAFPICKRCHEKAAKGELGKA